MSAPAGSVPTKSSVTVGVATVVGVVGVVVVGEVGVSLPLHAAPKNAQSIPVMKGAFI